jgi:hypothetical protein
MESRRRTFGKFRNETADRWTLPYSALIFVVFQLIAIFEHDPIPAASVLLPRATHTVNNGCRRRRGCTGFLGTCIFARKKFRAWHARGRHSLVHEYLRTFGKFCSETAHRWTLPYTAFIFDAFQLIAICGHDGDPLPWLALIVLPPCCVLFNFDRLEKWNLVALWQKCHTQDCTIGQNLDFLRMLYLLSIARGPTHLWKRQFIDLAVYA